MNLDILKQKMASMKNQDTPKEKKDYSKIYWKPTPGKHFIRIVPSKFNSEIPFTEIKMYYGIGDKKVMISPLNFGKKDPINDFVEQLKAADYTKENYFLTKKLEPKTRIFVPVIVRGEEEKGVRLWQFGKTIYETLLALACDEEVGDYTDVTDGIDLIVETVGKEATGTGFSKSTVRLKRKNSPLSEDSSQVEKWLKEQPNPKEQFIQYEYDVIKASLGKYLSASDEEEGEEEVVEESKAQTSTNNYTLNIQSKSSKKDEFEELFDE